VPQHAVAAVAAQTMPQGIGTIPGMLPARVMTQAGVGVDEFKLIS